MRAACDWRSGVGMKEANRPILWALALNLTSQVVQLVAERLSSEASVEGKPFKQLHVFAV